METAAAWGPCWFQLVQNKAVEEPQEPAAEIWAPTIGLPVEYASSIEMFGTTTSSLQEAYVPADESSGGQQLYYYYSAASQHHGPSDIPAGVIDGHDGDTTEKIISNDSCARHVINKVEGEFNVDMGLMELKMHRYPAILRVIGESYTVPSIVAIGHMMYQELYQEVVMAADLVRCLYDKDVMSGISYDDFRHMMFFDACFLVQFLRMWNGEEIDMSLRCFLWPKRHDILVDVMMLENQLPWLVVKAVTRFKRDNNSSEEEDLTRFIPRVKDWLQDHIELTTKEVPDAVLDDGHKPHHLLGIFRYYIVGRRRHNKELADTSYPAQQRAKKISLSISAMELAEIGITLKANKMVKLIDMGLNQGPAFTELSLAPVTLDRHRASFLVNMAALELCTVETFINADRSYLLLLAMLVHREEDVHELRGRGLLQGGGGLTNQEALSFFTNLQGLRLGRCYTDVMRQIESYQEKRRLQTKLYAFCYNNWMIITDFVTGVGFVVGIIAPLVSIKKAL